MVPFRVSFARLAVGPLSVAMSVALAALLGTLLAALIATTASCGGKSKPSEKPGDGVDAGPQAPPPVSKVLHIALEYIVVDPDVEPPTSRVSLILTDETGASRREVVGEFPGGCSDVSATASGEEMKPILALDCWTGDDGVQLRFVHRKSKLYVVSAKVRSGATAEYQPLKTLELPLGTPVRTDYTSAATEATEAETPSGAPGAN